MARPLSRPRALVLLALSLEPQAVPALADRLAQRGEFLADPEIRAHLVRLTSEGLAQQHGMGAQPCYTLASGAAVEEALDRAWALGRGSDEE